MGGSRQTRLNYPLVPLISSTLSSTGSPWLSSPSYEQPSSSHSPLAFHSVTDALLENPNLNSSHLFRADIISDSTGILKTNHEKEDICQFGVSHHGSDRNQRTLVPSAEDESRPACSFEGYELRRTVVRRLIPRKPQMDNSLLQTCHIYTATASGSTNTDEATLRRSCGQVMDRLSLDEEQGSLWLFKKSVARSPQHLVVYQPHADASIGYEIPWYHPPLSHLAFLYTCEPNSGLGEDKRCSSSFSIHFQLFKEPNVGNPIVSDRLHRTLLSLLSTYVRLTRNTPVCLDDLDGEEKAAPISAVQAIKDNIIPEHLLQNTYSRLKTTYAADLIHRWVEKTDPSKHVFEDLAITAFLIELWKKMYGDRPSDCPRFVDMACGNGVLVYCLIREGYRGYGFDARARRTWAIFPETVTAHLHQSVCIPKPFLKALQEQQYPLGQDKSIHDGIFPADTFIISNHGDELTAWTPILAALSSPTSPLPWLAIPCCSHALSGAAHRYSSSNPRPAEARTKQTGETLPGADRRTLDCDDQSQTGDLVAMRASKDLDSRSLAKGQASSATSTYASLVQQVMSLAQELDPSLDVRQTLMRIPSTRNIGIVGGERRHLRPQRADNKSNHVKVVQQHGETVEHKDLDGYIYRIVQRECRKSEGVSGAAKTWMRRLDQVMGTTRENSRS